MKHWWMVTLVLGCWMGMVAPASAQLGVYNRPQVSPRPTINPYLNLTGRGQMAVNYYGIVKPQLEMYQGLQQVHQEIQQLQPLLSGPMSQGNQIDTLRTGHPVVFQSTSHYFPQAGTRPGTLPTGYRSPQAPLQMINVMGMRR